MAQVVVGCKIPNGLHLDIYGEQSSVVNARATLNGSRTSAIAGGYGMTNVEKELWDAWYDQNKNHPAVKAGFIFAVENERAATSKAKEMKDERTGFEGIDPRKPGPNLKPDESMSGTIRAAENAGKL